jgi:hypothetical protein
MMSPLDPFQQTLVIYFLDKCYTILPTFHIASFKRKLFACQHPIFLIQAIVAAAATYARAYGDLPQMHLSADQVDTLYYDVIRVLPDQWKNPSVAAVQVCQNMMVLS